MSKVSVEYLKCARIKCGHKWIARKGSDRITLVCPKCQHCLKCTKRHNSYNNPRTCRVSNSGLDHIKEIGYKQREAIREILGRGS